MKCWDCKYDDEINANDEKFEFFPVKYLGMQMLENLYKCPKCKMLQFKNGRLMIEKVET